MGLGERVRRLDNNPASRGVTWLSDVFGWWWNLFGGLAVLILAAVETFRGLPGVGALYFIGVVATIAGLVMRSGRNGRRRDRESRE
jgi:hypothetical protein